MYVALQMSSFSFLREEKGEGVEVPPRIECMEMRSQGLTSLAWDVESSSLNR